MTDRILEFPRNRREEGPRLVLDLDAVRDNYAAFTNLSREHRKRILTNRHPRSRNRIFHWNVR
jgi:ornithine decarboxylase